MASVGTGAAWHQIRRLFGFGTAPGLTEWELLGRFVDRRDESAFAGLMALHGPMVLGVCRRMLADAEDVEDAFQATFLVLVRKARSLGPNDSLGPWLYGVACRVSLRARSESARRRSRELAVPEVEEVATIDGGDGSSTAFELVRVLDEELRRLPQTYRAAVVLCYLEGRTHEEAARQLGWPLGTVKGRLARARDLLRNRLTRRGMAMTSGGLGVLLTREARASVPAQWVEKAINTATRIGAGEATAGVVSASVASLVEGVLRTMNMNRWKTIALSLGAVAALAAGARAVAQKGGPPVANAPRPLAQAIAKTAAASESGLAGIDPKERARDQARARAVQKQLGERLTMSFPMETPLEDVLKYIKLNTQSEELDLPNGIPIYVDPVGLQEADKTMTSQVILDLEGVSLRRSLQLILRLLGLIYYVLEDGVVLITNANSEGYDRTIPLHPGPTPFLVMQDKAERGEMSADERKEFIALLKDLKEIQALLKANAQ
jgi:RNA polymerase sigma factor (sigma-70 family)